MLSLSRLPERIDSLVAYQVGVGQTVFAELFRHAQHYDIHQ
jgi:hypothetical protein